jgi:hypothetical protein
LETPSPWPYALNVAVIYASLRDGQPGSRLLAAPIDSSVVDAPTQRAPRCKSVLLPDGGCRESCLRWRYISGAGAFAATVRAACSPRAMAFARWASGHRNQAGWLRRPASHQDKPACAFHPAVTHLPPDSPPVEGRGFGETVYGNSSGDGARALKRCRSLLTPIRR